MEIRDKFAVAVLPAIYAEYFAGCREQGTGPSDEHWREGLALDAYMMADAMLAALRECDESMAESANPLDELSESERKAAKRLLKLCREMADNYGDDE